MAIIKVSEYLNACAQLGYIDVYTFVKYLRELEYINKNMSDLTKEQLKELLSIINPQLAQ